MLDALIKTCFLVYFTVLLFEPVTEFMVTMNDILARL